MTDAPKVLPLTDEELAVIRNDHVEYKAWLEKERFSDFGPADKEMAFREAHDARPRLLATIAADRAKLAEAEAANEFLVMSKIEHIDVEKDAALQAAESRALAAEAMVGGLEKRIEQLKEDLEFVDRDRGD